MEIWRLKITSNSRGNGQEYLDTPQKFSLKIEMAQYTRKEYENLIIVFHTHMSLR